MTKPPPASMKGAVCRNPQIKGQVLKPITSRLKGCNVKAPVLVSSVSGVALNLLAPSNTVWQSISAVRPGDAVNFHVDTNSVPTAAFYRILELP